MVNSHSIQYRSVRKTLCVYLCAYILHACTHHMCTVILHTAIACLYLILVSLRKAEDHQLLFVITHMPNS